MSARAEFINCVRNFRRARGDIFMRVDAKSIACVSGASAREKRQEIVASHERVPRLAACELRIRAYVCVRARAGSPAGVRWEQRVPVAATQYTTCA